MPMTPPSGIPPHLSKPSSLGLSSMGTNLFSQASPRSDSSSYAPALTRIPSPSCQPSPLLCSPPSLPESSQVPSIPASLPPQHGGGNDDPDASHHLLIDAIRHAHNITEILAFIEETLPTLEVNAQIGNAAEAITQRAYDLNAWDTLDLADQIRVMHRLASLIFDLRKRVCLRDVLTIFAHDLRDAADSMERQLIYEVTRASPRRKVAEVPHVSTHGAGPLEERASADHFADIRLMHAELLINAAPDAHALEEGWLIFSVLRLCDVIQRYRHIKSRVKMKRAKKLLRNLVSTYAIPSDAEAWALNELRRHMRKATDPLRRITLIMSLDERDRLRAPSMTLRNDLDLFASGLYQYFPEIFGRLGEIFYAQYADGINNTYAKAFRDDCFFRSQRFTGYAFHLGLREREGMLPELEHFWVPTTATFRDT